MCVQSLYFEPQPEVEMAQELRNMTSNPETLSSGDITDASVALENLAQSAIDNENVRKITHL